MLGQQLDQFLTRLDLGVLHVPLALANRLGHLGRRLGEYILLFQQLQCLVDNGADGCLADWQRRLVLPDDNLGLGWHRQCHGRCNGPAQQWSSTHRLASAREKVKLPCRSADYTQASAAVASAGSMPIAKEPGEGLVIRVIHDCDSRIWVVAWDTDSS